MASILDEIDFNHPAIQRLAEHVIERGMNKFFPPEPAPDPVLEHLQKMQQRYAAMIETQAAAAAALSGQQPPKAEKKPVYSEYLQQEGASQETAKDACISCGRSHTVLADVMLRAAEKTATEKGPDDPKVAEYLATANRELSALFARDWTPERITKTPAEDREVIAKYIDRVRDLQKRISSPIAEKTVTAWALLDEGTRFAYEDGIDHPEVKARIEQVKDLVLDAERVDLTPPHLSDLTPEQRDKVIEGRRRLRLLRQQLVEQPVETPQQLDGLVTEAYQVVQQLNAAAPPVRSIEDLHDTAKDAHTLREGFIADSAHIQKPMNKTLELASQVASGKITPQQAKAQMEVA